MKATGRPDHRLRDANFYASLGNGWGNGSLAHATTREMIFVGTRDEDRQESLYLRRQQETLRKSTGVSTLG